MGVKEVKLKELLLVFRNGASIKQFEGAEGLPITRIETISDATINPLKVGYANIFDDKYQDYYLQEGDILLSHINSVTHLGKCAIYTNPIDKLIHGMNLLMLRANKDLILPKYLYYVLNSKQFKVQLPKITKKSVNQASMTVTDIGNLKLLIEEDLEQQQKVVEILDKADEIRAKKKLANDKLDEFLKSTFISMFGDPIKNEKGWATKSLSSVAPIKSYSGDVENFDGKYWLLNLDVVESNTGKILKYNYEVSIPNSTCCFNGDMVLYSKLRPYLNKVVLPNKTGYATSELVPLNPVKEKLNKYFLASLLRSKCFVDDINVRVAGAKMPRVSMDYLRNFPIILPPIEEQNKFAEIVEKVEVQKQKNELVIDQMNNLFNSLSQRAFKGEL